MAPQSSWQSPGAAIEDVVLSVDTTDYPDCRKLVILDEFIVSRIGGDAPGMTPQHESNVQVDAENIFHIGTLQKNGCRIEETSSRDANLFPA